MKHKSARPKSNGKVHKATPSAEDALLIREATKIVRALGKMFAPCCEVVLHELSNPEQAILAIENPLSGRAIGQPTTEMGLARIQDPKFPDVVQNYANSLPDGRQVKSTSIGIRNSKDVCIAAICLNLDVSLFDTMTRVLQQFTSIEIGNAPVRESFRARSLDEVRDAALSFAASLNVQPRAMSVEQRRQLVASVSRAGLLQLRGAPQLLGDILGVARSSIYNAMNAPLPRDA